MIKVIGKGGFAEVLDIGNGRVLKAYLKKSRAHGPVRCWEDHDLLTSVFFAKEVQAYRSVMSMDSIRHNFPCFYGVEDPRLWIPNHGNRYVPGCGIILERIPGKDRKLAHLPEAIEKRVSAVLEEALSSLREVNVWDASCFVEPNDEGIKIIDFGLWDRSSDYEVYLSDYGSFTEKQRKDLSAIAES